MNNSFYMNEQMYMYLNDHSQGFRAKGRRSQVVDGRVLVPRSGAQGRGADRRPVALGSGLVGHCCHENREQRLVGGVRL